MTKQDWIRKLTSRKFWVCVASFVTMLILYIQNPTTSAEQVTKLIIAFGSVLAYIIGEGLVDASREEVTLVETEPDPVEDSEDVEEVEPESEE